MSPDLPSDLGYMLDPGVPRRSDKGGFSEPVLLAGDLRRKTERGESMARFARVIAVGIPHHITQRGNARRFVLARRSGSKNLS